MERKFRQRDREGMGVKGVERFTVDVFFDEAV
jgi:hypothetical protein